MAADPNDPNPALRAELLAALDNITPQIRGLQNFARNQLSPATAQAVAIETAERQRRATLISDVIASLDNVIARLAALFGDGYPELKNAAAPSEVRDEIQRLQDDLVIAGGVLGSIPTNTSARDQAMIDSAVKAIRANKGALNEAMA